MHMPLWLTLPCAINLKIFLFSMMAIEKYDLKVSLTQAQFSNVPQEQYNDYFTVPATWTEAWNHPCPFQRKL